MTKEDKKSFISELSDAGLVPGMIALVFGVMMLSHFVLSRSPYKWVQTSGSMEEFMAAIRSSHDTYDLYCKQRDGRVLRFNVNPETGEVSDTVIVHSKGITSREKVISLGTNKPCAKAILKQ